jgi:hypothetical protein
MTHGPTPGLPGQVSRGNVFDPETKIVFNTEKKPTPARPEETAEPAAEEADPA